MEDCFALAGEGGVKCAKKWWRHYQGGAFWTGFCARNEAMRDVLKVCDESVWEKYQPWEDAAWHGTFRIMHEEFCIVSDFPCERHHDAENRLHCETGPALKWRDGFAIYAWHGVNVPAEWIKNTANIDPADVLKTSNVEQRAAGCAILGWARMLDVLDAKVIDDSGSKDIGQLIELKLPDLPQPGRFLKAHCPRNGIICEGVPYVSDIDNLPIETAIAAQAWRIGDPQADYQHPTKRT